MRKKTLATDGAWRIGNFCWYSPFRLESEYEEELISREEIRTNIADAKKTQWPGCIKIKNVPGEYNGKRTKNNRLPVDGVTC